MDRILAKRRLLSEQKENENNHIHNQAEDLSLLVASVKRKTKLSGLGQGKRHKT